jgi:uncharacterized protein (DUF1697 family)
LAGAGVRHLALLRGINVGGKNAVAMADLRQEFEAMGFAEVATYINSGNVLFRAPRQKREALAARLEASLTKRFGIELKVVLLTDAQLRGVVESAPRGFGAQNHSCDVLFIRKPLTAKRVMSVLELKEGVDRAWAGKGVVYHARVAARASSSRISKFVMEPEYQNVTIRSWRTTTKLNELLEPAVR